VAKSERYFSAGAGCWSAKLRLSPRNYSSVQVRCLTSDQSLKLAQARTTAQGNTCTACRYGQICRWQRLLLCHCCVCLRGSREFTCQLVAPRSTSATLSAALDDWPLLSTRARPSARSTAMSELPQLGPRLGCSCRQRTPATLVAIFALQCAVCECVSSLSWTLPGGANFRPLISIPRSAQFERRSLPRLLQRANTLSCRVTIWTPFHVDGFDCLGHSIGLGSSAATDRRRHSTGLSALADTGTSPTCAATRRMS
jgi:hypothetical protein